ncbi:uncharacterized protein LOC124691430 [Lolium rigidum]|uniref:uncharacterized protein LOC124691430 n=1 Tax=Lolium rigidum TaxID=89674 RepID=UPI001F5D1917|nr:uncharacterized protein LOC124691430 [Lolium rigidum]
MRSHRRRAHSRAVKTLLDDDDLLAEILLRLPPQPSSLPRASLVCKRWHSLASNRGFSRRFRIHHRRKPPVLGFFDGYSCGFQPTLEPPNRVPPGRFSFQGGVGDRIESLGCRHGLVLIFNAERNHFLVWDTVTGDQRRVAIPSGLATRADKLLINGAVFREGGDAHFQVVLTVRENDDKQRRRALACVYSSETGLWGDLISTPLPSKVPTSGYSVPTVVFPGKPSVLAGNSIYWMLIGNFNGILELNLEKQSLAVVRVPERMLRFQFFMMRAEGGGLGLLLVTGSGIQLWKRNTDCDGSASWALGRTVELNKLLSLNSHTKIVIGFAEENNVVFLWAGGPVFMVHLESLQFKKLFETNIVSEYQPFESVFTTETGIGGGNDAADILHHP